VTGPGERIGIIAGSGHLPLSIAQNLAGGGASVFVAALANAADPGIENPLWETRWFELYSLKGLLEGLGHAGVTKVILAGKVGHHEIFTTRTMDALLIDLLQKIRDHRPSTILGALVDLLQGSGFTVLPLTEAVPGLFPGAGHLYGPPPGRELLSDLDFGWRIAKGVADLDIGQSVVVKNRAVVAVEAMEGTDRAIARAGQISRGGLVLVKLAARDHDFRYDVPTVGPETLSRLAEAGGKLLAVEAGRCLVLEQSRMSELCEDSGITLLACTDAEDGGVHWPGA